MSVAVTGLRNGNGQVLACLTANPAAFPDCRRDPAARKLKVAANAAGVVLDFGAVPAGTWAVSLIHDENGNGKMDKLGMIPREGYGFSRDAPVMMGPPRFAAAAFPVGGAPVRQAVKVRYIF